MVRNHGRRSLLAGKLIQACKFSNLCHCTSNIPTLKQIHNHNSKSNISLLAKFHDHGRSPHYEDCNHCRSPLLTEKLSRKIHDKFVNYAIDIIAHQNSHIEIESQPQLKIKHLITCRTSRPWSQSSR